MRRVVFKRVFDRIVMLKGMAPANVNLSESEALLIGDMITKRVRQGWEYGFWPEWTLIEERTPDSNSVVSLTQSGRTEIFEVQGVYASEKKAQQEWGGFAYALTSDGIDLSNTSGVPATVWVKFRTRPPEFSTEPWTQANADAGVYESGYVVYWPTTAGGQLQGECYRLSIAGEVGTWNLQSFPWVLKDYVTAAVFADVLRMDGQRERANEEEGRALMELARAWTVATAQQGLTDVARVGVRESAE